VFCFSVACPALTIYPARALGCLHGKYGMVCSLACPQVKGRSDIGGFASLSGTTHYLPRFSIG
jgi:hypothetical protein